jgi:hypothetical protein
MFTNFKDKLVFVETLIFIVVPCILIRFKLYMKYPHWCNNHNIYKRSQSQPTHTVCEQIY